MSGPLEIAQTAWGDALPDWVELLAKECAASSQNKVAGRLGRSASLVSSVLRKKYNGDMAAVEDVVRGVFERATVDCPRLGTIPANECRDWQRRSLTYSNVNGEVVRQRRACNRCPRNARRMQHV